MKKALEYINSRKRKRGYTSTVEYYHGIQYCSDKVTYSDDTVTVDEAAQACKIAVKEAKKPIWIKFSDQKPPEGVEVLAYHHKWVDEDFNPTGIRIGFYNDEDFTSAYWWNHQDCYMTISHFECDCDENSKSFYINHLDNIEPEYWMEIPKFK